MLLAGVVDQHVEAGGFDSQFLGQTGQRGGVVDVQLHRLEAGLGQGTHVVLLARAGPDPVAGALEGVGEGAADAAGAAGDEGDGLAHGQRSLAGSWKEGGLPYWIRRPRKTARRLGQASLRAIRSASGMRTLRVEVGSPQSAATRCRAWRTKALPCASRHRRLADQVAM